MISPIEIWLSHWRHFFFSIYKEFQGFLEGGWGHQVLDLQRQKAVSSLKSQLYFSEHVLSGMEPKCSSAVVHLKWKVGLLQLLTIFCLTGFVLYLLVLPMLTVFGYQYVITYCSWGMPCLEWINIQQNHQSVRVSSGGVNSAALCLWQEVLKKIKLCHRKYKIISVD